MAYSISPQTLIEGWLWCFALLLLDGLLLAIPPTLLLVGIRLVRHGQMIVLRRFVIAGRAATQAGWCMLITVAGGTLVFLFTLFFVHIHFTISPYFLCFGSSLMDYVAYLTSIYSGNLLIPVFPVGTVLSILLFASNLQRVSPIERE